jgi:hypothetical protein
MPSSNSLPLARLHALRKRLNPKHTFQTPKPKSVLSPEAVKELLNARRREAYAEAKLQRQINAVNEADYVKRVLERDMPGDPCEVDQVQDTELRMVITAPPAEED